MTSAVEKLAPSRLSDQEELLADDIDIASIELVKSATGAKYEVRPAATGGTVKRTIEGASTVTIPVSDPDDALLNGFLAKPGKVDVELDGLWFRLVNLRTTGRGLSLIFEDREVSLLRDYPKLTAPNHGFLRRPAKGSGALSRIEFARLLVAEVKEVPIEFRTTIDTAALEASKNRRRSNRSPGFQAGGGVTVKTKLATPTQLDNISQVLAVGHAMGARRKILVCSVMTITQESSAINLTGGDRDSVGLFQQRASQGWPASRDITTDSIAFFKEAITVDHSRPNEGYGHVCSLVQRDYTYNTPQEGKDFEQWHDEAEHTVNAWGLAGGDTASDAATMAAAGSSFGVETDTAGYFVRGQVLKVGNKARYKREDNWTCLQRLANEVAWRCFAVSGVVYFINDPVLFRSQPQMTISRLADGIDWIDIDDYDVRKKQSQLTVTARTRRWSAPPGTLVAVQKLGPASGRWLVSTIERDLLGATADISLTKPQPILPEDEAPEFAGQGDFTGVVIPGGAESGSAARGRMMTIAQRAVDSRADFQYAQVRPMPKSLFAKPLPVRIDCSAFVTLVYKAAGAPDPNGFGYNGAGNTGTLVANGKVTAHPEPGDLVFYGGTASYPHHVALYAGDGFIFNMGSPGEPTKERVSDVKLPLLFYMTYSDVAANPAQDAHRHGEDR